VRIGAVTILIALLALVGCQPESINQATTEDFSKARNELAARNKAHPKGAATQKTKARPESGPASKSPEMDFASVEEDFNYDMTGRDPFRSFEWEQLQLDILAGEEGPLEQFDVAELSLIGIIWEVDNRRALVKDPSGMSYIVAEGMKIGKNNGLITRIEDNLMVVKETYTDSNLIETIKDIEMRIRLTEGG
jgi:type IV pilus assembly protein PilP